ncbi:hypothetical protein KBA63_01445 [Candidatus Woesebacteria bacterium]|nr:hypothetical protein [Candidatus Woesebacteria bacterium]MBP9687384.1 hypothetical protein [Candidatus Woesebacteria bacterium]
MAAKSNHQEQIKKLQLLLLLFAALAVFFLVSFISVFKGDIRSNAAYMRTNDGSGRGCNDGGNNSRCPGKR